MRLDMVFLHLLEVGAAGADGLAACLGGEDAGNQAGAEVEQHHQDDEYQGRAPGPLGGRIRVRRRGGVQDLGVDEGRQGGHPAAEHVGVDGGRESGGDQNRRGFADHAGDRQGDAGRDAGDRRREDHLEDGPPLADAEGVGGLAEFVGHDLEHFLAGADHHRDHQHRQCDGGDGAGLGARADHREERGGGEQAGDNRGNAGHDVHEEGDGPGQCAVLAVFHEVDRGQQAHGDRDEGGEHRDQQGAHERVVDAAQQGGAFLHRLVVEGAGDPVHGGGEETGIQEPGEPIDQYGPDHREQGQQGNQEGPHNQAGGQLVLGFAGAFHNKAPAHQAGGEEDGGDDAPAEGIEADQREDRRAEDQGNGQDDVRRGLGQLAPGQRRALAYRSQGGGHLVGSREFFVPADDSPGNHVYSEGNDEQHQARGDQRADLEPAGLGEVQGDFGGDGLVAGLDQAGGQGSGGQHQRDGHGLAEGPAQSQHHGADDPGPAERQHGHPDHLPAGGPERQRGLFVQLGGLQEEFAGQGGDDRQDHDGEHDSGRQDGLAGGGGGALEDRQPAHVLGQPVVRRRDFLGQERDAPGAVDHGRDRGEEVNHVAQAGSELARRELRNEQRDSNGARRRDHECDHRGDEGADDERPDVGEESFAALDLVRRSHEGG